ncbi:3'-5' exonuclease [Geosporobacter ferrireducens]|uniref:3'-5' exonuclease n=1 Tax=Geosporobacter ferrireducens TaxID=1424294 RepID=UPI00147209C4
MLEKYLPEDYMVWVELNIKGNYPDFVVVGPDLGIMVLEVKDWDLNYIKKINKKEIELSDGTVKANPWDQSWRYCMSILNEVKRSDKFYKDKLKDLIEFPCNHAIVFPNIYQAEFEQSITDTKVLESKYVLFGDEINNLLRTRSEKKLVEKLKKMMQRDFGGDFFITSDKMREIRRLLYPEVIISKKKDGTIRTMDAKQEELARGMNYGNVIIKGVAGSGKTVILTARAKYLANKHADWNILVLCYNVTLCKYLRTEVFNSETNIKVMHFHGFFEENCITLNIDYNKNKIAEIISKLTNGQYSRLARYDAILVDEGQDFEKSWLEFLFKLLNGSTDNHFLLTSDGAQNLYGREYFLSDIGVQAEEIDILQNNYRNTEQILMFAYGFLTDETEVPIDKSLDKANNNFITDPKRIYRKGPVPNIKKCTNFNEEINAAIDKIKDLNNQGIPYDEIAVVAAKKDDVNNLYNEIKKTLKVTNVRNEDTEVLKENSVKISTLHSIKGLDYAAVIICGLNEFPGVDEPITDWMKRMKKAIYVGLTRAKDEVYIYYSKENLFTIALERARKIVLESKELYHMSSRAIGHEWQRIEEEWIVIKNKNKEIGEAKTTLIRLESHLESSRQELESEKYLIKTKLNEIEEKLRELKNEKSDLEAEKIRLKNWHNQLNMQQAETEKKSNRKRTGNIRNFFKKLFIYGILTLAVVLFIGKDINSLGDLFDREYLKNEYMKNEMRMQLVVGEYPKGYKGTYIKVSAKKDDNISGTFKKDTKIEFYQDNRVVIIYPDSKEEEHFFSNNIVKVEVANVFTEIYHKDQVYKGRIIFDYNFAEDVIVK